MVVEVVGMVLLTCVVTDDVERSMMMDGLWLESYVLVESLVGQVQDGSVHGSAGGTEAKIIK